MVHSVRPGMPCFHGGSSATSTATPRVVRFAADHRNPPPSATPGPRGLAWLMSKIRGGLAWLMDRIHGWRSRLAAALTRSQAAGASATRPKKLSLYPEIQPYRTHMLKVSPLHTIYVEESGNPNGFPVIFLHGGPAAGLGEKYRRFFNPKFFRIIGFDQRGCEKSTPLGELRENTTWDLVEDIQRIRKALNIDKQRYLIFGGSWGSLLALAAAETHPEDVAGLIIRGISLGRPEDLGWSTQPGEGVYALFPEAGDYWAKGMEGQTPDPKDIKLKRNPAMGIYYRLLTHPDEAVHLKALKYWRLGNSLVSGRTLDRREAERKPEDYRENLTTARIVSHYYYHNAFMDPPDKLIRDVGKLRNIPHILIVNGRDDLHTPPKRAWELYKAMRDAGIQQAKLKIVEDAGHSAWNDGITQELLKSLQEFEERQTRHQQPSKDS